MDFHSRLKYLRKERGFTQSELAHQLGITKSSISGYEKGKRFPKIALLKSMAAILGTTSDFLITGSSVNERTSNATPIFISDQELLKKHYCLVVDNQIVEHAHLVEAIIYIQIKRMVN